MIENLTDVSLIAANDARVCLEVVATGSAAKFNELCEVISYLGMPPPILRRFKSDVMHHLELHRGLSPYFDAKVKDAELGSAVWLTPESLPAHFAATALGPEIEEALNRNILTVPGVELAPRVDASTVQAQLCLLNFYNAERCVASAVHAGASSLC